MGQVNSTTITSGTVVNADIANGAGVSASKLEHHHILVADWGYADTDGTIATEEQTIFIASGAGSIREVKVWHVDAGTNTDIDYDLLVKPSGSSSATVLTGDINLVHGTGNQVAVTGTIASGTLSAGDAIIAKIKTVTQNTDTTGPRMQITMDSAYV